MFEAFPDQLTTTQVAAMLRVSQLTVRRNRTLSFHTIHGDQKVRIYSKADVIAYLNFYDTAEKKDLYTCEYQ